MKTYYFGNQSECGHRVEIKAKNFEQAVKMFSVRELFPESCVYRKHVQNQEYSSALSRYIRQFEPGLVPMIPVYEYRDRESVFISDIPLSSMIEVDYAALVGQDQKLLPGVDTACLRVEPGEDEGNPETELQVLGSKADLMSYNKGELRRRHDEIMLRKAEMEAMVQEMNRSMDALRGELRRKEELVYAFETFLGVKEEVLRLIMGQEAAVNEPLAVYQQVLYMDEEVGAWEDQGIDFERIEEFDEWIKTNFKRILYREKSVCAFRVRRQDKVYSYGDKLADAWVNMHFNAENHKTYFLIRNGENLYRIWGNVSIDKRMFPRKAEYEKIMEKAFTEDSGLRDIEHRHKAYLMGLIYLQGLIERTPILGANLQGVNLITGKFSEEQVVLIRDDEENIWIGDGKPSWDQFIGANRATIGQGTRIIISRADWQQTENRDDSWRKDPNRSARWPKNDEIYTVEEISDGRSYHGWEFLVRYSPPDEIWDEEEMQYRQRKRRVPFRLYRDEVINFDTVTLEECDYYSKNRNERKNYLRILPALHWIRKTKRQERALEAEFVRLIQGMLSWPDDRISEIQDAIAWWKLKNKWKRGLMKDDAKAVRMIVRKLKRESKRDYQEAA